MLKEIINILKNDCPNCYKGKVFIDKSFYFSIRFPKMYDHCSNFGYTFEKEPGYFEIVNYYLKMYYSLLQHFGHKPESVKLTSLTK
jgi:hypothetical protein